MKEAERTSVKPGRETSPVPVAMGVRSVALTMAEQQRVKAMQQLARAPDRSTYVTLQQEIAQQLQMSVRNVQHLVRAWERDGVAGVIRQGRSECP